MERTGTVVRLRVAVHHLGRLGLVVATYYASARLGLATGFLKGNVAAVWPPTGVALAVLFLYGTRLWPGIAIGALLVNGTGSAVPFLAACGMAAGNTLEALLGAYLLRRVADFRPSLSRVRDVLALGGLAAGISTLASAAVGVTSLWAAGVIPGHAVLSTGRVWWTGDGLSDLIVAPVILLALGTERVRRGVIGNLEALLMFVAVGALTAAAFFGSAYPYMIIPALAWGAIRFGPKVAATSVLAVSALAVVATTGGHGLFATAGDTHALASLDAFLAVAALMGLVLAAIAAERDAVRNALEAKVAARTAELDATEGRFQALVEGIPDFAIYMLDPDGLVLSWNAGAQRLMGYTASQIVGDSVARLHRPEDVAAGKPAEALRVAREVGRSEEEGWRVRVDGSSFWARVVVTPLLKDGELTGFAKVTQDVTAARDAEAALRQVVVELDAAQRLAHVGSFRVDLAHGEVAYWSDELFRILGLDPSSFHPSFGALLERVHPADRVRVDAAVGAAFHDAVDFEVEARIVREDGEVRVLATSAQIMRDGDGQPRSITGVCQDVTTRKEAEDALVHLAGHDGLTGLPNRTLVLDRLRVALARRGGAPCRTVVFFADIDRFKRLNDQFGHAAGDLILLEIGRRLATAVRPGDTVGRFGGDEFVIVCENLDEAAIAAMASRLMIMVANPISVDGEDVSATVSIGVAVSEPDANRPANETATALLEHADAAMYQAKERGRSRFEIFDARMRAAVETRVQNEGALRRALDRDEIVPYFQPVVDLASGRAVGVEALARWLHPTRGLILPDEFIPLAEESGLIVRLGALVLERACDVVAGWRHASPELSTLELAVNLSTRQLLHRGVVDTVRQALDRSGLPAAALCLEITESVLLDDTDLAASVLGTLKALGVRIALDDFGTGFSSLAYLKRLPVDVLKIDRSFVEGLGTTRDDGAIASGVVDLANAFAMSTVAEGVETIAQAHVVRALGCERAQGYLWSRPLAGDDALRCLRSLPGHPVAERMPA
ncbi:MAG: EAL domain-containing protein [Actinobacteria bacterium]|nr:EAL domain-containing protein [Actinomycetota bacterium]